MSDDEVSEFIDSLTPGEMQIMLAGLSGWAPDAFAESVATIEQIRELSR